MAKPCPTPRKAKHATKGEAIAHLIHLRRKDGAFTVVAYKCACGSWHVGHRPRVRKRRA